MEFLLSVVLLLPLAAGIVLLLGEVLTTVRPATTTRIFILSTSIVALCAWLLLRYGEQEVHLHFTWLPGSGELSLHVGGAGLYVVLATTVAALLAFSIPHLMQRGVKHNNAKTPLIAGVSLVALSAANVAFMAGHFLMRYVALEFVGLCVALSALLIGSEGRIQRAWYVYLLLRLGDVGMLTAILALYSYGDTLVIADALHIGERLPSNVLAWTTGGFVLAVAVKTGVWPFQNWLKVALPGPVVTNDDLVIRAWLYPVVMPNLGLYLLYRITPLLLLSPAIRAFTLMLAVLPLGTMIGRWQQHSLPVTLNAVLAALGLLLAAMGIQNLLVPLLIIATFLRLVIWASYFFRRGQLALQQPPYAHPRGMQDDLVSAARALQENVEHGILEQGLRHAMRGLIQGANLLHTTVEQDGLEGLMHVIVRSTLAASRFIQRQHTGQLRQNLGWVTLALLFAVVLLVSLGWR